MYKEVDSTADKAILVEGDDLLLLFQDAVFGLFSTMAEPKWKDGILPAVVVCIRVEAANIETLLVSFLEEVLYKHEELYLWPYFVVVTELAEESEELLFVTAEIVFADSMVATGSQIKAVTYHNLRIDEMVGGGYVVRITFDV